MNGDAVLERGPGASIHVVGGGQPTPAQLAAIIAALGQPDPPRAPGLSPWRLAGLLEGVGEHGLQGPGDLRRADAQRRH